MKNDFTKELDSFRSAIDKLDEIFKKEDSRLEALITLMGRMARVLEFYKDSHNDPIALAFDGGERATEVLEELKRFNLVSADGLKIHAKIGDTIFIDGFPRKIWVMPTGDFVNIGIEGYGDARTDVSPGGAPVAIDMYGVDGYNLDGESPNPDYRHPRVLVYADINEDDYTHRISLEGAQESLKKAG